MPAPEAATEAKRREADVAPLVAAERVRGLLAERIAAQERELRARLSELHHVADADQVREVQRELQLLQQRRRTLREPGG
jgi:hypothetical protein